MNVKLSDEMTRLIRGIREAAIRRNEVAEGFGLRFRINSRIVESYLGEGTESALDKADLLNLQIFKAYGPEKTRCADYLESSRRMESLYRELLSCVENVFLNSLRLVDSHALARIFLYSDGPVSTGKIRNALSGAGNDLGLSLGLCEEGRADCGAVLKDSKKISNKLLITLKMDINGKYDNINLITIKQGRQVVKKETQLSSMFRNRKKKRFGKRRRMKDRAGLLKDIEKKVVEE